MSWGTVARTDFRRAVSQRGVWALLTGFLLGFGGIAALLLYVGEPEWQTYLVVVGAGAGLLIPLAGIILGYDTIVGERESGTIALTLSLPQSRGALVVGKLVSRTALLLAAITGAGLITAVGMAVTYPGFPVGQYAKLLLCIGGYGAVFVWLSTALSVAISTSRRVIVAAFGAYLTLTLFWNGLITAVVFVLFRFQPPPEPEQWATFATFVGPYTAYQYLLAEVGEIGATPPIAVTSTASFITPVTAVLSLLAWTVVPVIAGYAVFTQRDL